MRFSGRLRAAPTFEFKEGTRYPALHQLEKKGLVRSQCPTGG
jgi:DNA-binding PadR family transcriptional regulator